MSLIESENLNKTFKIYNQGEGLRGYLKSFVSRDYEEIHAVEDLNLEIDEGEMIGYIGANGAGKSTTVKMLTGILEPSSGRIEVDGRNPHKNRKKNAMNIGVVFGQKTQLWWDLPVKESFKLLKEIYEVSDEAYDKRIEEFDEVLQLSEFWDQPVRKLSLGQKMRCELAAAFLHHPPVVYLDEPTIGLDVEVKERIRSFIKRMNRDEDITVMLTTHDIGDVAVRTDGAGGRPRQDGRQLRRRRLALHGRPQQGRPTHQALKGVPARGVRQRLRARDADVPRGQRVAPEEFLPPPRSGVPRTRPGARRASPVAGHGS